MKISHDVLVGACVTRSDVKSQPVRVADVFIVGPVMVAGGALLYQKGAPLLGGLLGIFGVATMAYNARNYALVARRERDSL